MSDRRSFRRPVLAVVAGLAPAPGPALAAGPAAAASPPTVLFVSPSGDDANTGTNPLRPVRTPERARDVVRTMNQQMTSDVVVLLLPGTYRLTRPLELDGRDSGGNGHRVIWTGLPLTRPVVSAGAQLTAWHPTGPGGAVGAGSARACLSPAQLVVGGVR